ncbi:MAG: radical SAM protein [Anaerolineae bacterium]|nr:radical SAM protein [Anaerolineae bacterium]
MLSLYPDDVGIILTYRCHGGCKHCLYNCGPHRSNEAMSIETLRDALTAVTLWPQPPKVHLTGGEPFLHFDLLLEGTRIAADLGITCYVETSAAWCLDEAATTERFAALQDAGMQMVLISCSPFHAERIPPIRTLRAIRAALATFGPQRTIIYQSSFLDVIQAFDVTRPTPLSQYEEHFDAEELGQLLWHGYGVLSGGRAGYALGHLIPKRPLAAFARTSCLSEMLYAPHSHFDLYGNVIPSFCGGLALGDWHTLPELIADFQAEQYPPLIDILIEHGPHGLALMAQEMYGYQPLPEGYAGKCHLCVDVRRYLVAAGDFEALRPQGFYEG